jgi:hypothetical protein
VRAGSSAEAQTHRNEHPSRSRRWPLSRGRGKAIVSWGAGSRCSGFWTGRLRGDGSRDEFASPSRGQTNIGGQRVTGPQRRPASLRAFPELGPVMRWPGGIAYLVGFHAVERNGVGGRHRAPRLGAVPPRLCTSAARWGSAKAGCRSERRGVERSEKPASQAPWGLAKCRELARWLATPSGRSQSARRAQLTALGGPGETLWGAGSHVSADCDAWRAGFWKPPSIGAEQAEAGGRVTALVVLGFLLAVQGPHLPILLLQRRRGLTFFCVGAALAARSTCTASLQSGYGQCGPKVIRHPFPRKTTRFKDLLFCPKYLLWGGGLIRASKVIASVPRNRLPKATA